MVYPSHDELKKKGRKLLEAKGCSEIYEEVFVRGEARSTRADLVGVKDGKRTAVECGRTPFWRQKLLSSKFDELIVLPRRRKASVQKTVNGLPTIFGPYKIHGGGMVQIPGFLRQKWGLKDGDKVEWIEWLPGTYVLESAQAPKFRAMQ